MCAQEPSAGKSERGDVVFQRQVVVDRLGNVDDADPAINDFGNEPRTEHGVVPADGDQVRDAHAVQIADGLVDFCLIRSDAGRSPQPLGIEQVRAGRSQDRSAVKMNTAHSLDVQRHGVLHSVEILGRQPAQPFIHAEHLKSLVDGFDGRGADDRVDSRGRSAADNNRHSIRAHVR